MRTSDAEADAGKVIKRIIGRRGTGGGHRLAAGGQIPLKTGSNTELVKMGRHVRRRYRKVMKQERTAARPLLRLSADKG